MKKLKLLAALSVAAVIFIAGCKKDEYQEKIGVCPLVVSTVPADKAIDIPLGGVITASFNEKMEPATIDQESFIIQQGTTSIAGTVAYSGMTASFTPSSPLSPNVLYSGTIKTLAKDLLGQALQQDYSWSFTTIAEVTLSSSPTEGGTTSGAGTFINDSTIIMVATANEGYSFVNWTLDGTPVSTDANYEFTMDGNQALVANFTLQFVLGLSSNPAEGGTTTGGGLYDTGDNVTVTATPNTGYTFINWTEGLTIASTDATYAFQLAASRTLVANFESDTYTLNVTAENGTVLKDPEKTDYNSGEIVVLTATPATGYAFTGWTGNETGTQNPLSVSMNTNKDITANFTEIPPNTFTLNVIALNGSVLKDPELIGYNSGDIVELTATPNAGYTFSGWSGDASGSQNPLSVTMNADMNITANFTGQYPAGVNLGSAGNFAILAGSGVSNTGVSTYIIGNVGSFPSGTINGLLAGNVDGILYTTADPLVGTAKSDLTDAYNEAQSRSLNAISLPGQLGGLTLAPGLYVNSSTSGISGTGPNGILTLDAGGDANAVWVFKMGSTLVTDAGTSIVLAGGAQAGNIYWSVGTSATLGTNSTFYGNILADQSITLTTGVTLYGRALTRVAGITLDSNAITKP